MNRGAAHTELVKACKQYLKMRGAVCMTNTISRRKGEDGRTVKTGEPGWADIIGCLPGGRFIAVECKTGKGELTALQLGFRDEVWVVQGIHVEARSIDDVADAIERVIC